MKAIVFVCLALLLVVASGNDVKCETNIVDPATGFSYYYDLSILHHDNQTFVDSLWFRTRGNVIYYVNFCGQTAAGCTSGDTSVCIRSPNGSGFSYVSGGSTSTQNISIIDVPGKSPKDGVTVTYSDGGMCNSSVPRQTKIHIFCQKGAVPGFFYDIDDSDPCSVILFMYSSAVCGERNHSSECEATLTKGGQAYHFDLRPLHHDDHAYVDPIWYRTDENYLYFVNFCGQTAILCDNGKCGRTSVCVKDLDRQCYSGGRTSTQEFSITPDMTFGKSITATYSDGAKCGDNKRMKTHIVVNCISDATPGYIYDYEEINECEVRLFMWSSAGCGEAV